MMGMIDIVFVIRISTMIVMSLWSLLLQILIFRDCYLSRLVFLLLPWSSFHVSPSALIFPLSPFRCTCACVYTCACTSVRVGVVGTRISALTRLFGRLQWLLQKRNKDYCLAHTKTIFTVFAWRKTSTTTQRQRRRGNGTAEKRRRKKKREKKHFLFYF